MLTLDALQRRALTRTAAAQQHSRAAAAAPPPDTASSASNASAPASAASCAAAAAASASGAVLVRRHVEHAAYGRRQRHVAALVHLLRATTCGRAVTHTAQRPVHSMAQQHTAGHST